MAYLTNLERDYVMGDTQIFNEFDNSHFISNAKSAITNKVEAVNMNMKFGYYTSMIEKAIQSFSTIKIDKDTINNFLMKFNNISKLDSSSIMVKDITQSDVVCFKPQYLAQYISLVQIAIDKAIKGDITQEEIVRYISGEIPEKIERQVVKTTLSYGVNAKDLIKMDNSKLVKLDTLYVKEKVIPFVMKYDTIKNETLTEANSVMNAIKETEDSVKAMLIAIEKIKASGNINGTKIHSLNQISFNAIRGVMEVISYVSFMLIRKLNNVSSNILSCNKLYEDISNMYADSIAESALDQNILPTDIESLCQSLIEGRADAYISLAQNIYDFHAMTPDADNITDPADNNQVNQEIDQQEYDKSVYEDISKSYIEISAGLDIIGAEGDEYLLIFDDVIDKSGFSLILEERFQNEIRSIKDISDTSNDLKRLLAEVKDFGNNMSILAKIIAETYIKLKYLQKRFSANNNGEYTDFETINELKIFLSRLESQYRDMTIKVAEAFFDRLKVLGTNISTIKENLEDKLPIETSSNLDFSEAFLDYVDDMFESIIESYEEENKIYFDALQRSYFVEKELVLRGVSTVFEADEPSTNNATQTTNNTNQDNNANTKVTVQDNNNQKTTSGNTGGITSKISEFIRKTLDRFLEFNGKTSTKNSKWLAENKTELMNRSYNNVTVNILPYNNIPSNQITDEILKVQNNIKTITPQTLQSITSKDALYSKLFPFISGGIKEANGSLSDQFTKYYKVGNGQLQVKPIANGELKTEITTVMIPFCEEYIGSFKDMLDKNLSSLGKTLDETIATYNTTTTTESVSIFTEADENVPNTKNSMKEKAGWMSEAIRYYTGSVLNAVRDRNVDYLKVLSSLVPKTPAKPVTVSEPNNSNNQQQEQPTQA